MKTIASFTVDHDKLEKGMYVSRVDGDVITYDIRMKKPNQGDYLSVGAMHSFEHLFATCARNSALGDQVLYVGPMGCRTGFYLLLRDTVSRAAALELVQDCFRFIAGFEGVIPGSQRKECGNYRELQLESAKAECERYLDILLSCGDIDFLYKGGPNP